jgi:uncharacterized repeat protein (TIGR01451 family)
MWMRITAAIGLATILWATVHVGIAHAADPAISIQLTAGSDQPVFQTGARVDFTAKVTCASNTSCGSATAVIDLGPNLTYETSTTVRDPLADPTTFAEVSVAGQGSRITFTIGSTALPFVSGEWVKLPISARITSVPATKQVTINASAMALGDTVTDALVIGSGTPAPNGADKVSVGGCVWWDVDRDGARSSGEDAEADATVTLKSAASVKLKSTKTDTDGCYAFGDLDAGTGYQLVFTAPDGSWFTTKHASSSGSIVDAHGRVAFTAPSSGGNVVTHGGADLRGMDAGLISYNLVLASAAANSSAAGVGDIVRFRLVASNEGRSAALAGWRVTAVLPSTLKLVSLHGSGYICKGATCTSRSTLPSGVSAAAVTLKARVVAGAGDEVSAVSYVRPAAGDGTESVPLGTTPTESTNAAESSTDNDAQMNVAISESSATLADTGVRGLDSELALGTLLVAVGGGLLLTRRSRAAN